MKRKAIAAAIAAAALAGAAGACKQPLDVGNFSVAGTWVGRATKTVGTDSVGYTFTLDLKQDQASISGSGTIAADSGSADTKVSGTWAYPAVTLQLTSSGFAPLGFASQFATRDSLKGTLTGSGLTGTTLTLVRQ
jgi:hypothetical protein